MTEIEIAGIDVASLDKANADVFYQLGILYSAGGEITADYVTAHKWFNIAAARGNHEAARLRREIATDYVTAHKWFNIAAARGNQEAARLRKEIANEMSEAQIASAQRAARDWLKPKVNEVAAPVLKLVQPVVEIRHAA